MVHHHESAAEKFAQTERLQAGIRGIVDAWEANVFRVKSVWAERERQRASFAAGIADWMNEEVVSTGGVITDMQTYEDDLTVQISETMVDDQLTDALEHMDNEQSDITELVRQSLHFTNKLLDPPEGQTQDQVLEESRKQSEADLESTFAFAAQQ